MPDLAPFINKLNAIWKRPKLLSAVLLTIAVAWIFEQIFQAPKLEPGEVAVIFAINYALVVLILLGIDRFRRLIYSKSNYNDKVVIAHVVGMMERSCSEFSRMGCKWGNIMERLYLKRRNLR